MSWLVGRQRSQTHQISLAGRSPNRARQEFDCVTDQMWFFSRTRPFFTPAGLPKQGHGEAQRGASRPCHQQGPNSDILYPRQVIARLSPCPPILDARRLLAGWAPGHKLFFSTIQNTQRGFTPLVLCWVGSTVLNIYSMFIVRNIEHHPSGTTFFFST